MKSTVPQQHQLQLSLRQAGPVKRASTSSQGRRPLLCNSRPHGTVTALGRAIAFHERPLHEHATCRRRPGAEHTAASDLEGQE